jgi:hypothetical protein
MWYVSRWAVASADWRELFIYNLCGTPSDWQKQAQFGESYLFIILFGTPADWQWQAPIGESYLFIILCGTPADGQWQAPIGEIY